MEYLLSLVSLLSFYAYPVVCFDISPMATALAAGFVLLGVSAECAVIRKMKRTAWVPILCSLVAVVSFFLIFLIDVRNRLADRGEMMIPVTFPMIIFSVAAAYVLLGTFLGWLGHRAFHKYRIRKADGPAS